ncbi:hypothetical protein F4804DRAFT_346518 [Jackrogersella minutella]|nr:hypothetical protein F4804DRAFT_346518 [Jackrogersella minutella]
MSHTCSSRRIVFSLNCFSFYFTLPAATVKISSTNNNVFIPTQPYYSALPPQEDLNSNEAITSSQSSFATATISPQDSLVFTTDSHQQSWPPSSSSSQPAQSAQQPNGFLPPQQDFVLFDQPSQPQRQNVNRTVSSPASYAAAFGPLNTNASQSPRIANGSPNSLQNQRLAQIIRSTGHQTSSPTAYTNRFNSQAQQQLYASLASLPSPTSTNQQNRSIRPPVPLFAQSNGNQQIPTKMDLQDAIGFEDLSAFQSGGTAAFSSPGVPGYDSNMSMSSTPSSVGNMATVSPHELFLDPLSSAPNSSAITNLTSPSLYGESPELLDNFEVSPGVGGHDVDNDNWYPLFSAEETQAASTALAVNDFSPTTHPEELELSDAVSRPRGKFTSSASPKANGKQSGSGVGRSKKKLAEISIDDPNDVVAMKRARNTLAARKSRARKAERFETLEQRIEQLTRERDYWKSRCEAATHS